VVKNIASGLVSAGHEVFVIAIGKYHCGCHPDDKDSSLRRKDLVVIEQIINYNICYIKPWNIFSYLDINKKPEILRLIWWFFNIFNFSGKNQVKNILQTEKPDVVMTHNLTGISFLIPRLIKKMKIKNIHTLHDIQLAYPSGLLFWGKEKDFINIFFLRVWYEKLVCWIFGSPEIVISPSKWLLEFYSERGFFKNSEMVVLPNPVKIDEGIPRLKEVIEVARDDIVGIQFLFVGTIEEYKGILFLIKTMKNFSGKFILRIVGNGRDIEKAKKLADRDERFEFMGSKNREEIAEIFANSDCLIFPTLVYENLPTVILEAFYFGLPVVASKIGGIPELVEENKTGWMFEPKCEQELKQIIDRILSKPEEIDKMREECFKKSEEFRVENYINNLIKLIKL
jgi:glycosyltransferase involved in cell wall biosynthesis